MEFENIEKIRIRIKKGAITTIIVVAVLVGVCFMLFNSMSQDTFKLCLTVVSAIGIVQLFSIASSIDKFAQYYKETVVNKIMNEKFDDVRVSYGKSSFKDDLMNVFEKIEQEKIVGQISTKKYEEATCNSGPNSYGFSAQIKRDFKELKNTDIEASDVVYARYKNVEFKQADVKINTKVADHVVVNFVGLWMMFDFEQKFKHNLRIIEKKAGKYEGVPKKPYMDKICVEDIEVTKYFDIYTDNELSTFKELKPQFINKIKEIREFVGCNISFAFCNNKLHISINNGVSSFEPKIFKENTIEKLNKEVELVIKFIDELFEDDTYFVE